MKMTRILATLASGAVLLAGCAKEYEVSYLDEIQLSQTFVSIPAEGGSVTVDVNAAVDWSFDKLFETKEEKKDNNGNVIYEDHEAVMVYSATPEWLSLDKESAAAGETTITFKADDNGGVGREAKLVILAGTKFQNITVRQGEMTASVATVKDVFDGADGQSFIVTGTCSRIANTEYGNWYMTDESTDEELYIYGTVDETGSYNWSAFNIEVGDLVTVRGSKTTYGSTVELVDAKFVEVEKSLLQGVKTDFVFDSEGGTAEAAFIVKGSGLNYDALTDDQSWISIVSIEEKKAEKEDEEDLTVVKLSVSPLVDKTVRRSTSVPFKCGSSVVSVNILQYPDPVANISEVFDGIAYNTAEENKDNPKKYFTVEGQIVAVCSNGFILSKDNDMIFVYAGDFYNDFKGKEGYSVRVCGMADAYNAGPQLGSVDFVTILAEGKVEEPIPVDLNAKKTVEGKESVAIDDVKADEDSGLLDITYIKATGTLSDPYHNLSLEGASTALAFYGNKAFDLDAYCDYCNKGETKKTITVKGYYMSIQSGRVNFVVTAIEPELEDEK